MDIGITLRLQIAQVSSPSCKDGYIDQLLSAPTTYGNPQAQLHSLMANLTTSVANCFTIWRWVNSGPTLQMHIHLYSIYTLE